MHTGCSAQPRHARLAWREAANTTSLRPRRVLQNLSFSCMGNRMWTVYRKCQWRTWQSILWSN